MQTANSVLNLPASVDPGACASFCTKAEADVAAIRRGILIFIQDQSSGSDLGTPIRDLNALKLNAREIGLVDLESLFAKCERVLADIPQNHSAAAERGAHLALDILAEIDASLSKITLKDDDFFPNISGFLDEAFEKLTHGRRDDPIQDEPEPEAEFEIDEETLEIFRSEATDLLASISTNLVVLTAEPNDREALWNIRRCAHTFKGAAGIVGLKEASELAHRVEDLLDQLAEDQCEIGAPVIELLTVSTDCMDSMTIGTGHAEVAKNLAAIYADFDRVISDNAVRSTKPDPTSPKHPEPALNKTESGSEPVKPQPAPIVRIALDRLDDLLKITRNLAINRSALAERFVEFSSAINGDQLDVDALDKIGTLFETQRRLTAEMQEKLVRIRMVRFGMLTTRLNRAVHVTCQEENKKAAFVLENEDVEIDTQILDSLVEPLLHLLRNAVVHGIESPERRRMIGKNETGQISIGVASGDDAVVVTVRDDGRGISAAKLCEKAVSSGLISHESAGSLTEEEAFDLMFLRGVTTADTLNINAGRGVGMCIVKESVGSSGGSISIASESQKGTTFTIRMPHTLAIAAFDTAEDDARFLGSDTKLRVKEQSVGPTVLIVDDSSSVRQLITRMMEKAGWKTITATDGLDAVETLSVPANRPGIILTDLEMPHMNGYELLEALKNDDGLRDIPVVMITSRAGHEHRKKAFDLGAVDFLTKPFEEDALIKIVDQITVAAMT